MGGHWTPSFEGSPVPHFFVHVAPTHRESRTEHAMVPGSDGHGNTMLGGRASQVQSGKVMATDYGQQPGDIPGRRCSPTALPLADPSPTPLFALQVLGVNAAPLSSPFLNLWWSCFLIVSCVFCFHLCNRLAETWDDPGSCISAPIWGCSLKINIYYQFLVDLSWTRRDRREAFLTFSHFNIQTISSCYELTSVDFQ